MHSFYQMHPNFTVYFVALSESGEVESNLLLPLKYMGVGYELYFTVFSITNLYDLNLYLTDENSDWLLHMFNSTDSYSKKSHLSDYLRFYLRFKYGGIYSDTDFLFLNSLPDSEFIGLDHGHKAGWLYETTPNQLVLAPSLMKMAPGKLFVKDLLTNVFHWKHYDPKCWECVGPKPLNVYFKLASFNDRQSIAILNPKSCFLLLGAR